MNGNDLCTIRDWLGTTPPSETPTGYSKIIGIINDGIKDDILNLKLLVGEGDDWFSKRVGGDATFGTLIKEGMKIQAIKFIRNLFKWGLKESKDFADANWNVWLNLISLKESSNAC